MASRVARPCRSSLGELLTVMSLKLRPTGLGHGVCKDTVDYGVFCGIGRIYETRTGPADLRWFWAHDAPGKPGTMRI